MISDLMATFVFDFHVIILARAAVILFIFIFSTWGFRVCSLEDLFSKISLR